MSREHGWCGSCRREILLFVDTHLRTRLVFHFSDSLHEVPCKNSNDGTPAEEVGDVSQ